jgi:predicted nucleic acid-binding Zn ribbon protein
LGDLGSGSSAASAIWNRWREIVGPAVADHARPRSLRDGTLRISVDEPAWATHLRYLSNDIVRRVGEVAGAGIVTTIEVSVRRP